MAEIELIQDRLISGKGVLKVPTDVVKNRLYILYTDVIRKPSNQYLNFNYNPPRSRYAWLVFMRNEYVLREDAVEFPKHAFDGVNDICGQTMLALKCAYKGILQTFINLGLALGVTPTSVEDTIAEYQNLRLAWDEVRVVCYADTAIQCRLYRLKYDVCDTDLDDDFPPPPPDPPREPVPPGTPIDDISEPYDDETNDDGNTDPFPGDELFDPPLAEGECVAYTITFSYDIVNAIGQPAGRRDTDVECWGIIQDIRIVGQNLQALCQGSTNNACSVLDWYTLFVESSVAPEPNLTYSIVES